MNVNVRLSTAACFLLLTFSSVFAAGFQAGKDHAEKTTPRPMNEGIVCPPQVYVAMVGAERNPTL